jgi:predicted HTH domain antitoxin
VRFQAQNQRQLIESVPDSATLASQGPRVAVENGSNRASEPGILRPRRSALRWNIMRVTIRLPEDISAALEEQWDDVPRRSLEAIAVEGYRTGALTESQVRRLLELDTRFQVHALLKEHHVPLQYAAEDLEDDLRAQRELGILPSR